MVSQLATANPLCTIPDPKVVQDRLAENLREARLLRQMLRLARKAAEHGQRERLTK
jgi:hypothetical protein